jgi:hypothetical protein
MSAREIQHAAVGSAKATGGVGHLEPERDTLRIQRPREQSHERGRTFGVDVPVDAQDLVCRGVAHLLVA